MVRDVVKTTRRSKKRTACISYSFTRWTCLEVYSHFNRVNFSDLYASTFDFVNGSCNARCELSYKWVLLKNSQKEGDNWGKERVGRELRLISSVIVTSLLTKNVKLSALRSGHVSVYMSKKHSQAERLNGVHLVKFKKIFSFKLVIVTYRSISPGLDKKIIFFSKILLYSSI